MSNIRANVEYCTYRAHSGLHDMMHTPRQHAKWMEHTPSSTSRYKGQTHAYARDHIRSVDPSLGTNTPSVRPSVRPSYSTVQPSTKRYKIPLVGNSVTYTPAK